MTWNLVFDMDSLCVAIDNLRTLWSLTGRLTQRRCSFPLLTGDHDAVIAVLTMAIEVSTMAHRGEHDGVILVLTMERYTHPTSIACSHLG